MRVVRCLALLFALFALIVVVILAADVADGNFAAGEFLQDRLTAEEVDFSNSAFNAAVEVEEEEETFYFGDLSVNARTREIRLYGEVRQEEGWVQFLLYFCGYGWLEEKSAIVSQVYLVDLQSAIAMLDWKLWDQLWHEGVCGREKGIEIFFEWCGGDAYANELVYLQEHLGIGDLVFLGSPFFDPLFLWRCRQKAMCWALAQAYRCPLFILHEEVEKKFVRESGESGYLLDCKKLPSVGTQVTVIIRVPLCEEEA